MAPKDSRRGTHLKERIHELRKAIAEYDGYGFVNDKEEAFISKAIDMDEQSTEPTIRNCTITHKREGGYMVWSITFVKKIMED